MEMTLLKSFFIGAMTIVALWVTIWIWAWDSEQKRLSFKRFRSEVYKFIVLGAFTAVTYTPLAQRYSPGIAFLVWALALAFSAVVYYSAKPIYVEFVRYYSEDESHG